MTIADFGRSVGVAAAIKLVWLIDLVDDTRAITIEIRKYNSAGHCFISILIITKLVELFGGGKISITLFCSSHVAVFYIGYNKTARGLLT